MYCRFFGFEERPFEMTADPKYLFLNAACKKLLSSLFYGVQNRRGIILIIGQVGTGKTMLLNALKDSFDKDTKVAFIFNTDISFKQLLNLSVIDLGLKLPKKNMKMAETVQQLNGFAIEQSNKGGKVVLIVDEAQNLSKSVLENLRLLSNLETRQTKLIQIILCGQPRLDYKLNRPELVHLIQRIGVKLYTKNLSEEDTYRYIAHRLKIAGYKGQNIFNKNSLKRIWLNTKGVPLRINMICENSLMIGYALEKNIISEGIIAEAIRNATYSPFQIVNREK